MRLKKRDLSELTQRAGRADGWRDFNGMLNPAVASSLRTGRIYLPTMEYNPEQNKQSVNALMPNIIGRLLRRSKGLKIQNWFLAETPYTRMDKLEYSFSQTTDPELIETGAGSDDFNVRLGVARNANTPVPVLNRLVFDNNKGVRLAIIANPHTPVSDLEFLILDAEKDVRSAAREKLDKIMGESWTIAKFGLESEQGK